MAHDRAKAGSTDPRSPGVVLLHGIARTARSLRRIERALQAEGFATLNLDYPSRSKPLDALAAEIHPQVSEFADTTDQLHFLAHSMGGLLTRVYLARHRPPRLGRVVMLGTPNGGSEVADLLKNLSLYRAFYGPAGQQLTTTPDDSLISLPPPDYPVGIIAGIRPIDPIASYLVLPRPNDGRVSLQSAQLAGMADLAVVKASHTGLVRHPVAVAQAIAFLRDGRFESSENLCSAA